MNFTTIMECLVGRKLEGSIEDYSKELDDIVNRFNQVLKIKSAEKQFVSTYFEDNTIMAPVPFVSNSHGRKVKVAYMGLNPHLDTVKQTTRKEKHDAGLRWEEYENYYTSEGIFKHVLYKIGKFYRNVLCVTASIRSQSYVGWEDFKGSLTKEQLSSKALDELQDYIGIETIPFHSKEFQLGPKDVEKLLKAVPEYGLYIENILRVIQENVADDGWIICNGKSSCDVFQKNIEIHSPEQPLRTLIDLKDERAYSFHLWNGRKVLFFHHFIGAPGKNLKLCANEDIKQMLEHAFETFGEPVAV